MSEKWSVDELKDLEKNRDKLLMNLVQSLIKDPKTIFAAKFGFGIPPIDIIEVKDDYSKIGYSVKLPIFDGGLSSLPYYRGFGEAIFFIDQMIDHPYLLIPDIEVKDFIPFISGASSMKRWKRISNNVGLISFDKSYNLKKLKEPRYPMAKKFVRLEVELVDIMLKYCEVEVQKGKEPMFERYKNWLKREKDEIGDKMIMAEEYAKIISEKLLREEGMYSPTMEFKEEEIESRPYPIPVFVIEGEGNYLGNNGRYKLVINRINGDIIEKSFK